MSTFDKHVSVYDLATKAFAAMAAAGQAEPETAAAVMVGTVSTYMDQCALIDQDNEGVVSCRSTIGQLRDSLIGAGIVATCFNNNQAETCIADAIRGAPIELCAQINAKIRYAFSMLLMHLIDARCGRRHNHALTKTLALLRKNKSGGGIAQLFSDILADRCYTPLCGFDATLANQLSIVCAMVHRGPLLLENNWRVDWEYKKSPHTWEDAKRFALVNKTDGGITSYANIINGSDIPAWLELLDSCDVLDGPSTITIPPTLESCFCSGKDTKITNLLRGDAAAIAAAVIARYISYGELA